MPHLRIGKRQLRIGMPHLRIGKRQLRIGMPHLRIEKWQLRIGMPQLRIGTQQLRIGMPQLRMGKPLLNSTSRQSSHIWEKVQSRCGKPAATVYHVMWSTTPRILPIILW